MRVVIASRIFSPEPAAASFRLAALANALTRGGATVAVLTTAIPGGHDIAAVDPSVRVSRWPVLRDASGYVRGYAQYMSFDIPLALRLIRARRADVVVVEPPPTTGAVVRAVCAITRTPYVYYAADVWSDAAESTGSPKPIVGIVRAVEKWALAGASRVIAVNDGVADRVRSLSGRSDIDVVTNGVDTTVFTPAGRSEPDSPLAVYVGMTSEWQGAEVFLRAMSVVVKEIPDARLVFVGQGSAWNALKDEARTAGLTSVEFVDTVPPSTAARWLRSARVALVSLKPGQGYDFAFPTKVFAAVASGTPVIYAGPGPARAVIEAAALGEVVDHSVGDVAAAMVRALRSEGDAARLAQWAEANASIAATATQAAEVVLAGE